MNSFSRTCHAKFAHTETLRDFFKTVKIAFLEHPLGILTIMYVLNHQLTAKITVDFCQSSTALMAEALRVEGHFGSEYYVEVAQKPLLESLLVSEYRQ